MLKFDIYDDCCFQLITIVQALYNEIIKIVLSFLTPISFSQLDIRVSQVSCYEPTFLCSSLRLCFTQVKIVQPFHDDLFFKQFSYLNVLLYFFVHLSTPHNCFLATQHCKTCFTANAFVAHRNFSNLSNLLFVHRIRSNFLLRNFQMCSDYYIPRKRKSFYLILGKRVLHKLNSLKYLTANIFFSKIGVAQVLHRQRRTSSSNSNQLNIQLLVGRNR